MKRINLTKFGFIRNAIEDFSDDGTRFTCYYPKEASRVRVTKATYKDDVYINGSIRKGDLIYNEYSKLPHYSALSALNGVSLETLTDSDLEQFYRDCIAFSKEYEALEATLTFPTENELRAACEEQQKINLQNYSEAVDLIKQNLLTIAELSQYETREIYRSLESLGHQIKSASGIEDSINSMLNNTYGRLFIKHKEANINSLKNSYSLNNIKKIILKI